MKKISVVRKWFQVLTVVLVTCDKKARSPGDPVGEEAVEEPEEMEAPGKQDPLNQYEPSPQELAETGAAEGLPARVCTRASALRTPV